MSNYLERRKDEMGPGFVPCIISDRWLQFPPTSSGNIVYGEMIEVFVMTNNSDGNPKKICNMIIAREDLLKALENVKNPDKK